MTLQKNVVCRIAFQCRDIGYGVERGGILGYWTGDVDTWGKFTIQSVESRKAVYLFKDEITDVSEAN